MFIRRKEYDELNARIVILARIARDNKEKKDIAVHNNTILLERNRQLEKLVKNIAELATSNDYNRSDVILAKIRDLVRDYQSKN